MPQVMMYGRFSRFWHWAQTVLVAAMLITGFEIHGDYRLLGFERAVDWHIVMAWTLIVLWVFTIFWHLTTGEWKQYLPSSPNELVAMARYYAVGIFRGGEHPHRKQRQARLNPLQRMAYLSLHVLITPAIWASGLLYLFYKSWPAWGLGGLSLAPVALVHTAGAYAMLAFLSVHLYLALTTSSEPLGYLKAMVTGYEDER